MDKNMVSIHLQAAKLSELAYLPKLKLDTNITDQYTTFQVYRDEPDQALIVTNDEEFPDVCFVVFRGTTKTLQDWLQNVGFGFQRVCNRPAKNGTSTDSQCWSIRNGFYDAFFKVSYFDEFIHDIYECAGTTLFHGEQRTRDVVVTGHSQGGSVASIAAMHLHDLNPTVVTFGQPRTCCQQDAYKTTNFFVNPSMQYHYVNSILEIGGDKMTVEAVLYDPITLYYWPRTSHLGQYLFLSPNDVSAMALMPIDKNQYRFLESDSTFGAHSIKLYSKRLYDIRQYYAKTSSKTVSLDGYATDTYSSVAQECRSKRCVVYDSRKSNFFGSCQWESKTLK
jgi:Lipase (class 3)